MTQTKSPRPMRLKNPDGTYILNPFGKILEADAWDLHAYLHVDADGEHDMHVVIQEFSKTVRAFDGLEVISAFLYASLPPNDFNHTNCDQWTKNTIAFYNRQILASQRPWLSMADDSILREQSAFMAMRADGSYGIYAVCADSAVVVFAASDGTQSTYVDWDLNGDYMIAWRPIEWTDYHDTLPALLDEHGCVVPFNL